MNEYVTMRQQAEREIVLATIAAVVAAGWTLWASSNGEERVKVSTPEAAFEHASQCDEGTIHFRKGAERAWFLFMLGESGWDTVSDYTVNLTDPIDTTEDLTDDWAERLTATYRRTMEAARINSGGAL